jgi:hypothetical protein
LLFLITNETPVLGKLLKVDAQNPATHGFKCEFLLVKFEVPYQTLKSESYAAPLDAKMEGIDIQAIAQSREIKTRDTTESDRLTD